MNMEKTSQIAIITSRILGIVSSILGYAIAVVIGLPTIFGTLPNVSTVIFVIVFLAIAALLISHGIKTKRRIKRFKRYVNIISGKSQTSLENIASICSQSIDFVTNDIQKMINKKFFIDAYIDQNTNEIVFQNNDNTVAKEAVIEDKPIKEDKLVKVKVITCKGCGASNSIPKGTTAQCEFCGSAIQA